MIIALLSACWSTVPDTLPPGDPDRPDIIFVSIDTLRADHLSSYGHSRETSPFLDRLAAEGVRFSQARSASPWTLPAHTTMLTGQLPSTHRVVDDNLSLADSVPVLPALLQEAGYNTGGFVSTLYVSRKFGFERGFDAFNDFGINTERQNLAGGVVAEDVVDAAMGWLAEQPAGEPGFVFLHFYDVHYAYDPPAPYATMFDRAPQGDDLTYKNYFHFKRKLPSEAQFEHQIAQYDESIRYVDAQLERLDALFKASGREVRWVVTSDHGEEFGERGSWGHAHTLYAEQLHVPLIVSGGGLPQGRVVDGWVGSHDLAPTVAAWAGVGEKLRPDGIDLADIIAGQAPPERIFLAETTRFKTNRLSILSDGLRLEWNLKSNALELFDPGADPKEATDLADERSDDVKRLQAQLVEALGVDWQVDREGMIELSGNADKNAFLLTPRGRHIRAGVRPGDCFLVLPYDADVVFKADDGSELGPWRAAGGAAPSPGVLTLLRASAADEQVLDEATRLQLEAIGYMGGDEDDGEEVAVDMSTGGIPRCGS